MRQQWLTVEFLGGPLDGAYRPIPAGSERFLLANGAVLHMYVLDEIHCGHCVRQVMRHHEVLNVSNWFA